MYFYLRLEIDGILRTLAMVSLYTLPDPVITERSSGALLVCGYEGDAGLVIVDVKAIVSVIAMVPFVQDDRINVELEQFFVVEKPGLDFAEVIEEDDIGA